MKSSRGKYLILAMVGAVAVATPLASQMASGGDDDMTSGLNLPKNITIFGNKDPNVRTATAIVNGTIITQTDVDQRLALVVAANGGRLPEEERERLRLQVLRNLIDETLQIQEAAAQKIEVSKEEVEQTYLRVAANFKKSPQEFSKFLRDQGSSDSSIKRQIEGENAWRRVLSRKVEPFVAVSDEEVNAIIARLNASKGANEYHVGEIFLSATPETSAATLPAFSFIFSEVTKPASWVTPPCVSTLICMLLTSAESISAALTFPVVTLSSSLVPIEVFGATETLLTTSLTPLASAASALGKTSNPGCRLTNAAE